MSAYSIIADPCGPCCETVMQATIRRGSKIKAGFPKLMEKTVAGRYIAPGWTGVPEAINYAGAVERANQISCFPWNDPVAMAHFGIAQVLASHTAGQVVKRRTGAATFTTYTANGAVTSAPPAGGEWTAGGDAGAAVNTYIVTGFWTGPGTFAAGDLVYRCIRSADEADDDWHITPYLCTLAVTGAGDPRADMTHFTPLFGTADGSLEIMLREVSLPPGPGPVYPALTGTLAAGDIRLLANTQPPWRSAYHRAVDGFGYTITPGVSSNPAFNDATKWQGLTAARLMFDAGYLALPHVMDCRGDGPFTARYSTLVADTQLTGATADAVTNNWSVSRVDGQLSQDADGPLSWGGVGVLPSVGALVATVTVRGWFRITNPGELILETDPAVGTLPATMNVGERFRVVVTVYANPYATSTVLAVETWEFTCISHTATIPIVGGGFFGDITEYGQSREGVRQGFSVGAATGSFAEGTTSSVITFEGIARRGGDFPTYPVPWNSPAAHASPNIVFARLTQCSLTALEHQFAWRILAAQWTLVVKQDGAIISAQDQLADYVLEQTITLGSEFAKDEVKALLEFGPRVAGDCFGAYCGTSLRWAWAGASYYAGSAYYRTGTPFVSPALFAAEAQYSNLGAWCKRTNDCATLTCADMAVPTFNPVIADIGYGVSVRAVNNCTCAP